MEIRTRRWTRSPRGCILGVATGLAEWRGLPVNLTRLLVLLVMVSTAFFPALIVYLLIALLLPEQTSEDVIRDNYHNSDRSSNYSSRQKEDDDLKKRYENLKRKVEGMENDLFDREKEWDAHFKAETAV
ncbi:MAG: PspC domain-containing protein [Candidatus Ornithospirochaeta sp.]